MICFLYPSLPFSVKSIDPMYEQEQLECLRLGYLTANIDIEELFDSKLKLSKAIEPGTTIIYRGWMLKSSDYQNFENLLNNTELKLLTSHEQYISSHYISGWYPHIENLTIKSIFQEGNFNIDEMLKKSNFKAYFIKDYVKSLTTSRGSIAHSKAEVQEIIDELINKRGEIEVGLCIREFVKLCDVQEERYFVFNGQPFSRNSNVPPIVFEAAEKHPSPFFSIDVAKLENGEDIIIEIGDGQVSDIKLWTVEDFYKSLQNKIQLLKSSRSESPRP